MSAVSSTTITEVVVGVDTHRDVHVAVAVDLLGVRVATTTIPASPTGYQALETWAATLGTVRNFGIEGTGSYGSGLSRFLRERGHAVFEVNRPNRQLRRQKGKSDAVDADAAAGAVLAGRTGHRPAEVGYRHGRGDPSSQDRSGYGRQRTDPGHADAQGPDR